MLFTWRTGSFRDFLLWCTFSFSSVFALWSLFRRRRPWSITFIFAFAFLVDVMHQTAWTSFGANSFCHSFFYNLGTFVLRFCFCPLISVWWWTQSLSCRSERRGVDSSSRDPSTFLTYSSSVCSLLIHSSVRYIDCTGQMCLQLFRIFECLCVLSFSSASSLGVSLVDKRTSSHFVSNPWPSSRLRVTLINVTEFQNSFVDTCNTEIHVDHISRWSFVSLKDSPLSRLSVTWSSDFSVSLRESFNAMFFTFNLRISSYCAEVFHSVMYIGNILDSAILLRNIVISFDGDFLFDFG